MLRLRLWHCRHTYGASVNSAIAAIPALSQGKKRGVIDEIWAFRQLLRALIARNLRMRYQRSALGFVWALLNPLFTVLILVTVFRLVLRIDVPGYWAFLISGYFPWVFVMHTLGQSATLIRDHSYMTRSIAFPSEILVISVVASRAFEFVVELVLVGGAIAIFYHHGVPASFLALPLIVVLHLLLTLGIALPLSALSVFFHDVQHALPVALTLLGFISPVYYPLSLVPEGLRWLFRLNPFANVLTLYHAVLHEGRFPTAGELGLAAAAALLSVTIGALLFRWKRPFFAEIV